MNIKKSFIIIMVLSFLMPVFLQGAFAYDPNWEENQRKIFEQLDVKPGDVIDKTNCKKIEGLVPKAIISWVKKDEWTLKIGEFKLDFSPDKQYIEASSKNAGRFKIVSKGSSKYMVEAATGKVPKYVYGRPFPNVDVKNDPDGVIKLMYNAEAEVSRGGSQWNTSAALDWVGEGGYERSNMLDWIKYSFWQRPDGEQPNPKGYKFMEMMPVSKPYDSKGVVSMYIRRADGRRDTVFTYIPAIRRVKRMSGAGRSDPVLGSDTCMDDAGGWSGDNCSMAWKFLEEKIALFPIVERYAKVPKPFSKQADGSWRSDPSEPDTIMGWMDETWNRVPWAMLNVLWIPRWTYVVEATPLDHYYAYGKTDLYLDREAQVVACKIIYNKAMEYWKMCIVGLPANDWEDRRSFNSTIFLLGVDDRTHHATQAHTNGSHRGAPESRQNFNAPQLVNRALFVPSKLRIWSK